VGICCSS